jgi:hypothetical protein
MRFGRDGSLDRAERAWAGEERPVEWDTGIGAVRLGWRGRMHFPTAV